MPSLENQHYIVTGASNSLGAVIAQGLSLQGARVWNLDTTAPSTPSDDYIHCDLSSKASLHAAVSELKQNLPSLNGIIANAGAYVFSPIEQTGYEDLERLFMTNVFSHYQLISQLITLMPPEPYKHIILIGSDQSTIGRSHNSAYAMTKAALAQLARSLAAELMMRKINVNCISPASMAETGMTLAAAKSIAAASSKTEAEIQKAFADEMPSKQLINPKDIANLIVFLCQQQNSSLNGTNLQADGGFCVLR